MVSLVVSAFICGCTGSRRSCGLSVAAIWSNIGRVLCGLHFLEVVLGVSILVIFMLPFVYPTLFVSTVITLRQVPGCPFVGAHGCVLATGTFYCLGAGWSQWRPLDIPGTHLLLSLMQVLMINKTRIKCVDKGGGYHHKITTLTVWVFTLSLTKPSQIQLYTAAVLLQRQSIKLFLFTIQVP